MRLPGQFPVRLGILGDFGMVPEVVLEVVWWCGFRCRFLYGFRDGCEAVDVEDTTWIYSL